MEEQEIIEKAKNGDRAALSELVKKYEKTVFSFAFKICRDKDKAENTMQETFLSMVKSLHQFDSRSKLSTWLYRITMNHCLMEARSKKHQFADIDNEDGLIDERYLTDWDTLPLKTVENKELRAILDDAISKLAPEYRIVFLLRDVEENSTEETATITGLSEAAVKSRLHRARGFLRNEITKAFQQ